MHVDFITAVALVLSDPAAGATSPLTLLFPEKF